jgi:hypothetical protein
MNEFVVYLATLALTEYIGLKYRKNRMIDKSLIIIGLKVKMP